MKFALGMIVRNEEKMLRLTLPVHASQFKIKLALDSGSTDATCDILKEHGFTIMHTVWRDDYSWARNQVLDIAQSLDVDWMLMLDADETMFPERIVSLKEFCDNNPETKLVQLPRINLADGGKLQEVGSYPDLQARCLRPSSGLRYELPVHEVIKATGHISRQHIFHYGFCKSPAENWTRSNNYELISAGLPTRVTPEGDWPTYSDWIKDMKTRHTFAPFLDKHPLENKL